MQAITGSFSRGIPINLISPPRTKGGNVCVEVTEKEYAKGVEENKYSVIGQLLLQKGDVLWMTLGLKQKLSGVWGISNFRVLPIGKGVFHVFLFSMEDQSTV